MPTISRQFNSGGGAVQWPNGLVGVVGWTDFDRAPRTTRVVLHRVAWVCDPPAGGGPPLSAGGRVTLQLVHPASLYRITLIDAIQGTSTDPERFDRSGSIVLCPGIVPRERWVLGGLDHFFLFCESAGLAANTLTTLSVDYDLQPWPDGSPLDGGAP
jgi:hypothetical protein